MVLTTYSGWLTTDGGWLYRCDRCLATWTSPVEGRFDGWCCRCVSVPRPNWHPGTGVVIAEAYDPSYASNAGHPDDQPLRFVGTLAQYLGIAP